MPPFTLHCFAESGNAYKAALMLSLSRAPWKPVFVDFFNGGSKTPEFLELNPMGEVPVLVHGDVCLAQSGVILHYLCDTLGQFGPENEQEKRDILRWILFDNHKLTSYLATYRFLKHFAGNADPAVLSFFEGRAKGALKVLNKHLAQSAFAIGDRPTIADFSLCGYLYFRDEIGFDFDVYPEILGWLKEIESLEGWSHPYDLMPSS